MFQSGTAGRGVREGDMCGGSEQLATWASEWQQLVVHLTSACHLLMLVAAVYMPS